MLTYNDIVVFCVISFSAFILKSFLLLQLRIDRKDSLTIAFVIFGFCLIVNNILELMAYIIAVGDMEMAKVITNWYGASVYFISASLLYFCFVLLGVQLKALTMALIVAPIIMAVLHVAGVFTKGFEFNGYTFIRIPTEYYVAVEIYIIGLALVSLFLLVKGITVKSSPELRARSILASVGLIPFLLGGIALVVSMHFSTQVGSSTVLPVLTIFIVITCRMATRKDILDYSYTVLFSFKMFFLLLRMVKEKNMSLKEKTAECEKALYVYYLDRYQWDAQQVAEETGISVRTVQRKIREYRDVTSDAELSIKI